MKTLFTTAVLLFAAISAWAQILPEVYTVTGVATNDTLNVRARPNSRSADIGDIYPNEQVEVIALSENGTWGKIISGEANGWVAMRFLRLSPLPTMPDSAMPLQLVCTGTEPFWAATFWTNRNLEFKDFATASAAPTFQRIDQSTTADGFAPVSFAFTAGRFTGTLDRAKCSDGMSDRDYGWQLRLIEHANGRLQLRNGCCQAALN